MITSKQSLASTPLPLLREREQWLRRSMALYGEELRLVKAAIRTKAAAQGKARKELAK